MTYKSYRVGKKELEISEDNGIESPKVKTEAISWIYVQELYSMREMNYPRPNNRRNHFFDARTFTSIGKIFIYNTCDTFDKGTACY